MLSGVRNMAAGASERRAESDTSSSTSNFPSNLSGLLWEEKPRTLRELVSSYRLPLAVKLKSGNISHLVKEDKIKDKSSPGKKSSLDSNGESSTNNNIIINNNNNNSHSNYAKTKFPVGFEGKDTSSHRPAGLGEETILQIHEMRRKKIILARKMTWEKRQNDYVVTGEQVEIPASFKGWIEVVPDDGRPVEYFDTVGGITSVKPRRFLVRTSTVGYQLSVEENGSSCWMPVEIKPGEVLTTGIIYMDNKKNKNATQRNIFKRLLKQSKAKKEQDLKYLQCFDSLGQEIMIPLIMSGVFSPVGDAAMANYDAVYELQDLIMAFGLPVNAQLIHCNNREEFQCPKGVIRLYGTREEEMVIVSRVGSTGSLFGDSSEKFEMSVDQDVLFQRGVVKKTPAIKAKLVDVFQSHLPSKENKDVQLAERVSHEKLYGKTKVNDLNDLKVRQHQDRRMSTPVSQRVKPFTANYAAPHSQKDTAINYSHRSKTPPATHTNDYTFHAQTASFTNPTIIDSTAAIYKSPSKGDSSITSDFLSTNAQNSMEVPGRESAESSGRKNAPKNKVPVTNVELPERAPKEMKKSKSTGILDKLSVRKVKKERAKLKELRSDDVFSRRIVRNELSYQDFFNGLGREEEGSKKEENVPSRIEENSESQSRKSSTTSGAEPESPDPNVRQEAGDKPLDSHYNSLLQRRQSIQHRDLPPIPPESPGGSSPVNHDAVNESKDSLYEHLPPAPHPPSAGHYDDEEDGYMMPIQLREEQKLYNEKYEVKMRNKPPVHQDNASSKTGRSRRVRSAVAQDSYSNHQHDNECPLDIDRLFSFAYNAKDKDFGDGRPMSAMSGQLTTSTSHLYGPMIRGHKEPDMSGGQMEQIDHRFMDNLDLEMKMHQQAARHRSKQSKNMNANPNATIRSHNLRKMRPSALELFHFTDSFRDIRLSNGQEPNSPDVGRMHHDNYVHGLYDPSNLYSRPPLLNCRSMEAASSLPPQPNYYTHPYGYAESEPPCFRQGHRSSVGGGGAFNEGLYFKQGDDSAISLCSRGDGGFPNESEGSYNEYADQHALDDGWTPPDSVDGMSVQEVAKSLRYIGMKDRVVLRFSNEQIDGSMLGTLDKKLLQEGFPELNAFELKKILDFVQGWRPKKR